MKYNITNHCKERYIERVLGGCNVSNNIFRDILNSLFKSSNVTSNMSENNPRYVLYVKERYGSDKGYTFLKDGNVMYILCKKKGTTDTYDVITCIQESGMLRMFENTALSKGDIYMKLALL